MVKMDQYRVLIVYVLTIPMVSTTNELELQRHLMANYSSNIIPSVNNTPVDVQIQMNVDAIVSIDEPNEVLTSKLYVIIHWYDDNLRWKPEDFGNKTYTAFKQKQIWVPDLILSNSISESVPFGFENMNLQVSYTGLVYWVPGVTGYTFCALNTKYFPFDEQICYVEIAPLTTSNQQVRFSVGSAVKTKYTYENGQWELTSTSSSVIEGGGYSFFSFGLHLKRRPTYYITTIIVPIVLVSILNCFTFVLPKNSGERMGYTMAVFLSFILILTIMSDTLPKTSKQTSILVIYISALLVIGFLTIVISTISLAIDNTSDTKSGANKEYDEGNGENPCSRNFPNEAGIGNSHNSGCTTESGQSFEMEQKKKAATKGRRKCLHNVPGKFKKFLIKYFERICFYLVWLFTIVASVATYVVLLETRERR